MCFATGCQGKSPTPIAAVQPPVISEPKVGAPTPLKPGEEAGISVDVVSCPAGITLTYDWKVEEGEGEIIKGQGSPAITYRAPDMPGIYNIRMVVEWDGQRMEKTTSIKVEEEPTPTNTPTPTPTPTATPTNTPTPTPTATPTNTPTPTPTDTPLPPTDTPTPQTTRLEITGIICKPYNDPVDMDGNKVFLATEYFNQSDYVQSGFWVTVVNPQPGGGQIDAAQIIAFKDANDTRIHTWDKCDFALKGSMRRALGGDLDEVANVPLEARQELSRTLVFIYNVQ